MNSRKTATSPIPRSFSLLSPKSGARMPAIFFSGDNSIPKKPCRMTNDEARRNDETRMTKETSRLLRSFNYSGFLGHSTFVLRQFLVTCQSSTSLFGISFKNRSEEHTSELQSHLNLVCRLLLEKKKKYYITDQIDHLYAVSTIPILVHDTFSVAAA